jgi:hypothetical protein
MANGAYLDTNNILMMPDGARSTASPAWSYPPPPDLIEIGRRTAV